MSNERENYWKYLDGLPRKDVLRMAQEELLDVRGLSVVKNILDKYNLTNVTIDHNLRLTLKKSIQDNPRKAQAKTGKGK